jgi:hypothetical protein
MIAITTSNSISVNPLSVRSRSVPAFNGTCSLLHLHPEETLLADGRKRERARGGEIDPGVGHIRGDSLNSASRRIAASMLCQSQDQMTPMLTALVIGAAASIGWMNQRQYQLGGGWIGNNGAGNIWNALQIPLDPAGRTAALRIHLPIYNTEFAGLLTALGADSISDAVGEVKMVGRNTANYRAVLYLRAQGNPPALRAIAVQDGTVTYTGPDNLEVAYTIDVYSVNVPGLPNADADADGFPNPGSVPIISIPGLDTAKRVPAL